MNAITDLKVTISQARFARALIWSTVCLVIHGLAAPLLHAADKLNYTSDVRPILSDRCFFCHGPDAERREADLRLDDRDAAYEFAIVPGMPDDSEIIARIFSDDPEMVMPPPESKIELTAAEKEILRSWVAEGAIYEDHWAFQPVERPELLDMTTQHPIDQMVSEVLAQQGLTMSPKASRETLVRRLYFDLTGLPPTVAEVDAFVQDESADAYESLVDRLLSSEHYGERLATDWLDVARYADTYGYQNDRYRAMWPWRDWVVNAFNENLPYDQFIRWQLAGDLLPNPTRQQVLATAFNRNHRQTNEGGSVEEEFRAEYVADRVNTFGAAFLGLTLECSRCHDHKYDPISQQEYYQLAAFFNSIDESGLYSHFTEATPTPTLQLSDEQQREELMALRQRIKDLEQRQADFQVEAEEFAAWRAQLQDVRPSAVAVLNPGVATLSIRQSLERSLDSCLVGHYNLEDLDGNKVVNLVTGNREGRVMDAPQIADGLVGNGLLLSGDNGIEMEAGGSFTRHQPFSLSLWIKVPTAYERAVVLHRSRAWTDAGSRGFELLIEDGKLSAGFIHFWPGNALRVVSQNRLPLKRWVQVGWTYDGSSRADGLRLYVDGEPVATDSVRDKLTKHIVGSDGFGGGGVNRVAIGQRFRDNGLKDGSVDEFKVFEGELSELEMKLNFVIDALPGNVAEVLHNIDDSLLKSHFRSQAAEYDSICRELNEVRKQASAINDPIPEIMVMRELPEPRRTFILNRGAYDAPDREVSRGLPAAILADVPSRASDAEDLTRLDLANWLVDRKNPLTARVAVNRFWQSVFGKGLVETSEDFGLQGSLPSHPRLLDWLAAEFMDHGWDVKRLLKVIVMSETYQQRSDPSPQLLEIDPENRLLARGPAFRLPAEMIRDLALSASGLLSPKLGGPPVKPYQPPGLWKEKSGSAYKRDVGEGSRRRSLYTYWKRTSPPPAMMALDASNREVCVVRRQVTLTPMQVLVLMNDPQYVEAAKSLAERVMTAEDDLDKRLQFAFRTLVARRAKGVELAILRELYEEQLVYFRTDAEAADELLGVGDHKPSSELDAASLAALTVVVEALLGYDETVMKR